MTRKQKAAAVAGAVAVAAATGSIVTGPASDSVGIVEEATRAGSFGAAMTDLEQAVDELVDKSFERGMDIQERSEGYTPGIDGVIVGMDGMAPTKGTTRSVQVASGGSVAKGDRLKVCEEFTLLGNYNFGGKGARIVAMTSNGVDGMDCVDRQGQLAAVLYAQGGNTYLRTMSFEADGNVDISSALAVVRGEELENADMAFDHDGQQIVVVYNQDGDGWIARVNCTTANSIYLSWSERWQEGGDPRNICMAYDSFSNFACVCSTVLPDGSANETERVAVLREMCVLEDGVVLSQTPCPLTAENCPCLYGIDYSTAPTDGGWDIAYATNWHYDMLARKASGEEPEELTEEDGQEFVLHISYPKAKAGGRGLITVDHDMGEDMALRVRNYVENTAAGYSSASTVAIDVGATTGELGYVAMTDVVHSVYLGERNYLFIETYGVQKEGSKPVCYMRCRPEEVYDKPLENLSYALMGWECAIGYTVDDTLYAQIQELQRSGAVFGPAVKVADVSGRAGIVPVSHELVACIYADSKGAVHIMPLRKTRVVAKESDTMAAWAVGTALESGEAGAAIRADLSYWPDEQW